MENKSILDPQVSKTVTPVIQNAVSQVKEVASLIKPMNSKKVFKSKIFMIAASFLVVVAGVATGWFLAGSKTKATDSGSVQVTGLNGEVKEAGLGDESSYKSNVEGVLKKGGIKGEGTHYIDRDLGESKYVYLTSSVVDLESFVDKKVTVWGDTISAKYASWMIDVGKIKVMD